jgi:pyruvate kinase
MIKAVGKKYNVFPGILADLQGPKIRTGSTDSDKVITLKAGDTVILTTEQKVCTDSVICIDYQGILDDISVGEEILINDGSIRLRADAIDKKKKQVTCAILTTGVYSSHKGVNFPKAQLRVPSFTEKDKNDLAFILSHDIQYIALSFVRKRADIMPLKAIVKQSGKSIKIIAKIEKPEAEKNLDDIIDVCDGIMVARGDLGIETSPYVVPLLQKSMIALANQKGKIVIVATQMLESMIERALPTRAESTDVANAIIDGADALMLSGETAMGMYPVGAVDTMSKIADLTEQSPYFSKGIVDPVYAIQTEAHALCKAAAWASRNLNNIPILVFTISGDTAFFLSKIRAQAPVFAFSPSSQVVCQLALAWNIRGFLLPFNRSIVSMQQQAENLLIEAKVVRKGDSVLVISGTTQVRGATNFVRVKKVGEE